MVTDKEMLRHLGFDTETEGHATLRADGVLINVPFRDREENEELMFHIVLNDGKMFWCHANPVWWDASKSELEEERAKHSSDNVVPIK